MKRPSYLWVCSSVTVALATVAAMGQTFSYTENFNSVAAGAKPPGWSTVNSSGNTALDPKVFAADPAGWVTLAQNYGVTWSGGKRLNLIHPGQDGNGRSAAAWYSGVAGPHTGTYPLALQTDKLKAEFDLSYRTGTSGSPADGGVFAIQPVLNATDAASAVTRTGAGGGGMAWAGLTGFAIEFDIWDNGANFDPVAPNATNHVGLDVYLKWCTGDQLPSLKTNVDLGVILPSGTKPYLVTVGDNNQPVHFTVYYNDPAEGGLGTVRVYLKVDPAKYEGTGTAISYGVPGAAVEGDTADGKLILEACVGAWPTPGAVFGFTGSTGGANSVQQVDNVHVETDGVTGEPCVPGVVDKPACPPATQTLNAAGKVGDCTGLDQPGWNVKMFPRQDCGTSQAAVEANVAYAAAYNAWYAQVTGEPSLAYQNVNGCGMTVPSREFPGMSTILDNQCYGMIAKGWICFPMAGQYILNMNSDDGYQVLVGTGTAGQQEIMKYDGGRGCGSGDNLSLTVTDPGVYPIQILYYEGGGGSGIAFTRVTMLRAIAIGTDNSLADQPTVYGLYNGNEAPDLVSTYPCPGAPGAGALVELNANGAVQSTCSGLTEPGWDVRTYQASFGFGTNQFKNSVGFWNSRNENLGRATVPYINFNDSEQIGLIGSDLFFPGLPNGNHDNFGVLAKGWICFPTAGDYLLNLSSDDGYELIIGTGITNQIVIEGFDGGPGFTPGSRITLTVTDAGVYPIQLLYYEGGGGAGIEFYTITPADVNCQNGRLELVGTSTQPNEPLVFTLLNGQEAPDLIATYPIAPLTIDLAASEKVPGTAAGVSGVRIKIVRPPTGSNTDSADGEAGNHEAPLRFLDFIDDMNQGGAIATVINFRGSDTQGDGYVSGGVQPPGFDHYTSGDGPDQYCLRAEGFITFDTPGPVLLGASVDDDAWIRVGRQTIWSRNCCGQQTFALNVLEAGTYPFRLEFREGGGGDVIEFAQFIGTWVAVNDPASSIHLSTDATSGPYAWPERGVVTVPQQRMVAGYGEGTDPGWTVTLAQLNLPELGKLEVRTLGIGMALIENQISVLDPIFPPPTGFPTQRATDLVSVINYADNNSMPSGQFNDGNGNPDRGYASVAAFLDNSAGFDNDDFALGADGYIEVPAPGLYAINSQTDDGIIVWIAGKLVNRRPEGGGAAPNPIGLVRFDAAGIYPIHVDYNEGVGNGSIEVFQVFPDRSVALLGGPNSTLKVYRGLSVPPASTAWLNPHRLQPGSASALINRGGESGFLARTVKAIFPSGGDGGSPGAGQDMLNAMTEASQMLDYNIGSSAFQAPVTGGNPLLRPGTVSEVSAATLEGENAYGPNTGQDFFVTRIDGYLGLSQGSHLFRLATDDGFKLWIGGADPVVDGWEIESRSIGGLNNTFWLDVPEDGVYAFRMDQLEYNGGAEITFQELVGIDMETGDLLWEPVNGGSGVSARAYKDILPCLDPFMDANGDGSVDEIDFGRFQLCYTGPTTGLVAGTCRCFDLTGPTPGEPDGVIDSADYAYFLNCWSGPRVPWVASVDCPQ